MEEALCYGILCSVLPKGRFSISAFYHLPVIEEVKDDKAIASWSATSWYELLRYLIEVGLGVWIDEEE